MGWQAMSCRPMFHLGTLATTDHTLIQKCIAFCHALGFTFGDLPTRRSHFVDNRLSRPYIM
ncbi:hypothetical protein AO501_03060 [Mycobacterium gordonae]|uniref:Uncharacterized protein n=1 Tax=Mycobacterium gordonae TaxID=1778 RepID=A0A0Q2UCT1_MYCGO|nr:hypothetical protein AO501_03060 [Mycobacterium gordonae]